MKRMAALLAVAGLMATVPATAGAGSVKKLTRCGGEHYLRIPFTQTNVPIPTC